MERSVYLGDCVEVLKGLSENSVDAVVTDPPYELNFMGKGWDATGIANDPKMWAEVLRVLKPGGHLLSFGGTRTYHRMACAIEDAGFEIRDQIQWLYGSGFPKSKNLKDGWEGWGTALKPANEPICMARKPLSEDTVTANVLRWGTGALNIDASRVDYVSDADKASATPQGACTAKPGALAGGTENDAERTEFSRPEQKGRWPANVIHDGSDEVLEAFPDAPGHLADASMSPERRKSQHIYGAMRVGRGTEASAESESENEGSVGFKMRPGMRRLDAGTAARFFYCAKTSRAERERGMDALPKKPMLWSAGTQNPGSFQSEGTEKAARNNHPTVKPIALMRYLITLVTPPAGVVLDPFLGSGTTAIAAKEAGFGFVGIEKEPAYFEIIKARLGTTKDA